jgi:hypothetical protein
MKIFNIFIKDIKTISRNWAYFAVLFAIPLALVLTSSVMLNSNNLENVRIGVVDNVDAQKLELGIGRTIYYNSLAQCIYEMSNSEVSVCVEASGGENLVANVYLDSTKRVVSFYVRQAILDKLFSQQSAQIRVNSNNIETKLAIYSNSIKSAKTELKNTERDLEEQEQLLVSYKNDLAIERQRFDEAYYQIKSNQARVGQVRATIVQNQNSIVNNMNYMRSQIGVIRNSLVEISNLVGSSNPAVQADVNSALNAVNNIDNSLNSLPSSYPYQETIQVLDQVDLAINQLDEARSLLDRVDNDLTNSLEKVRATKDRVTAFRAQLDEAESEIFELKDINSDQGIGVSFIEAFPSSSDFVILAFPFVVSIVVTFTSLVLSNRFTVVQINHPSYLREIISPTRDVVFVISNYIINLFFVFIQAIVLLIVGMLYFNVSSAQVSPFLLTIFLTSSVFILVGISLAYLIKNESLSVLTTLFLVMFTFIFSDVLVPSILSGILVRLFINLNPFVMLNNILIGITILNKDSSQFISMFFKLGVMFVSTFLIAYLSKKASKENVIQ